MSKFKLVIAGAGDHARVLIDIIKEKHFSEFREWEISALTDAGPEYEGKSVMGIPVEGDDRILPRLKHQGICQGLVGVGLSQGTEKRSQVCSLLESAGFQLPVLIHPSALIASHVEIGGGSVILAGAIVGTACSIGKNVIINIGAAISHDCVIADHAVVSDGAHVTGGVELGEGVLIGAGATVLPYVRIGPHSIVAAGAVVTKNVEADVIVAGVPAKVLRSKG